MKASVQHETIRGRALQRLEAGHLCGNKPLRPKRRDDDPQPAAKRLPELRVLFVSGHSNEAISGETLLATSSSYLQKPYRGHALIAKIGEVLAGSSAERRAERTMESSLFRRASVEHVAGPFDDLEIVG